MERQVELVSGAFNSLRVVAPECGKGQLGPPEFHTSDPVSHSDTIDLCYYRTVIQSFADETTRKVWDLERAPRLGVDVQRAAHKRLQMLDVSRTINDLRVPPGNRLEKLTGDRSGQYSIRVNDQYRICFTWTDAGPADVQIVDYH